MAALSLFHFDFTHYPIPDIMKHSPFPSPEIVTAKASWLIWIVPVVALCISAYLLLEEFGNRGPLISIRFQDGSGLEANQTRLLSRGVTVGRVERIALTENLSEVRVDVRLDKSMRSLAAENSRFWVVRPEISMSGIQGLETLMSGPYIYVDPGEGAFQSEFKGLDSPPQNSHSSFEYRLRADRRISAHPGVPVLFRGLPVGSVTQVDLSNDASEVWVTIRIEPDHGHLVRPESRFWDAGGVNLQVNLLGAKLRTGSMESLLAGAIEFATPPEAANSSIASPGSLFVLHTEAEEKWLKWKAILPPESESGKVDLPNDPST